MILDGLRDDPPGVIGVNFFMPFLEEVPAAEVAASRARVISSSTMVSMRFWWMRFTTVGRWLHGSEDTVLTEAFSVQWPKRSAERPERFTATVPRATHYEKCPPSLLRPPPTLQAKQVRVVLRALAC